MKKNGRRKRKSHSRSIDCTFMVNLCESIKIVCFNDVPSKREQSIQQRAVTSMVQIKLSQDSERERERERQSLEEGAFMIN